MNKETPARVMDLPVEEMGGELLPASEAGEEMMPVRVHEEEAHPVTLQQAEFEFGGHLIRINTLEDVKDTAMFFLSSGLFPDAKTENQMRMKILVALELGCFNFHGLRAITVIIDTKSGIPSITVNYSLLAALVNASGRYSFSCPVNDETRCEIEFYDRERLIGKSTYTIDRAQRAGLMGKKNWQESTEQMLYAAAMRNGVKSFCPDLIFLKKFGASIA